MATRLVAYRGMVRERALAMAADEQGDTDTAAAAKADHRARRGSAKRKAIMLTPELLAAGAAGEASGYTEYVQREGNEAERGQRWAWDANAAPLTAVTY